MPQKLRLLIGKNDQMHLMEAYRSKMELLFDDHDYSMLSLHEANQLLATFGKNGSGNFVHKIVQIPFCQIERLKDIVQVIAAKGNSK